MFSGVSRCAPCRGNATRRRWSGPGAVLVGAVLVGPVLLGAVLDESGSRVLRGSDNRCAKPARPLAKSAAYRNPWVG